MSGTATDRQVLLVECGVSCLQIDESGFTDPNKTQYLRPFLRGPLNNFIERASYARLMQGVYVNLKRVVSEEKLPAMRIKVQLTPECKSCYLKALDRTLYCNTHVGDVSFLVRYVQGCFLFACPSFNWNRLRGRETLWAGVWNTGFVDGDH